MVSKVIIFLLSLCNTVLVAQSAPALKLEPYQIKALQIMNQLRAKDCHCGNKLFTKKKALIYNKKIEKAAAAHARDIEYRKILTHIGKDGSRVNDRFKSNGYNYYSYAENIAEGYDTIEEVFAAWMNSPGHCKNIMGDYKEVGIFKVGDFWVIDFGTQKENQ